MKDSTSIIVLLFLIVAVALGIAAFWVPRLVGPAVAALAAALTVAELE